MTMLVAASTNDMAQDCLLSSVIGSIQIAISPVTAQVRHIRLIRHTRPVRSGTARP
jgi:hypothetical protein